MKTNDIEIMACMDEIYEHYGTDIDVIDYGIITSIRKKYGLSKKQKDEVAKILKSNGAKVVFESKITKYLSGDV